MLNSYFWCDTFKNYLQQSSINSKFFIILSFLLKLPHERGWKSKISTKGISLRLCLIPENIFNISNIFTTFQRNIIHKIPRKYDLTNINLVRNTIHRNAKIPNTT